MLIGAETEYGIAAPGRPDADPVALSEAVVEHVPGAATPVYEGIHNRVLGNGARLYVDHGHPEYATPETTSASGALVAELAGDRLVAAAAARASEELGTRIAVFKNNTDGKGASYGYHENVLLRRSTPWERVVDRLPAFLATRVLFTGAGRLGLGPTGERPGFQLSQRADFFERLAGLDTTRNRGLINTRDEPHARPSRYRRLHVIPGDANRNPYATWLRLGTLGLVLAALDDDALPAIDVPAGTSPVGASGLPDAVALFRATSRDVGVSRVALGIQRRYLDACAAHAPAAGVPEASAVLAAWAGVLDDLERDPASAADRVDWVAKLGLLERLRARDGLDWDAPRLAQLDLAWAELDPARSPFAALERSGRLRTPPVPGASTRAELGRAVERAMAGPPRDTRAFTRGLLVARHPDAVVALTWDSALVRDRDGVLHTLRMSDPTSWSAADVDPTWPLARIVPGPDLT